MKFAIHDKWFFPAVYVISLLCVNPLFALAGMPSPLEAANAGHGISGVVIWLITGLGITFVLGSLLSFILTRVFPKRFNA